jgi:hypothetical protein
MSESGKSKGWQIMIQDFISGALPWVAIGVAAAIVIALFATKDIKKQ